MSRFQRPAFLEKVDDLGMALFGERNAETSREALRKYQGEVQRSYLADTPYVGPTYALVKVTNRCNSGCVYCNHSIRAPIGRDQRDISSDAMFKVLGDAADLGVRSVNFSGGEPLLRADLPQLVSFARDKHLVPILLTNGLNLVERWREMGEAGLKFTILSIDSLDPACYDRVRGAAFARVWGGFEAALRLRDEYPPHALHVTSVVTRHNLAEMPGFVRRMAFYGVPVQLTPYHHFDPTADDDNTPHDREAVKAMIHELVSQQESGLPVANSRAYLTHFPDFFEDSRSLPGWYHCYAAYVGVFVDAELNVRPCWSWSLPVIGNLGRDELRAVWYSDTMRQQRCRVRQLDCSRCWLLCTAELSIRFEELDRV